jgi:hypothetical protein
MRTFVNNITRWDTVFTAAIFGLHRKKVLSGIMPRISHSGDGYETIKKDSIAQFLKSPAASSVKYPRVARIIEEWIESGPWGDLPSTAKQTWEETF